MIAGRLISDIVTPIKTSDTGESAINHMAVYHVSHLPIVNNTQFLGLISQDEIYDNVIEEPIGSYRLTMVKPFSRDNEHIFEVMQKMALYNLTLIPVLDQQDNYLGAIALEDLLQFFANSFSFREPGSILIVTTNRSDYLMSEIARIAESEGGAVLSSFVTSEAESTQLVVTLKLSIMELSRVVSAFERYGYQIEGKFTEDEFEDALKSNYDSLMRFLEI